MRYSLKHKEDTEKKVIEAAASRVFQGYEGAGIDRMVQAADPTPMIGLG